MSPTSVVTAVGHAASTPQGAHHRRLQLRWWSLSNLPPSPHGGPPSTSPTSVVAATRPTASTPQGGSVIDVFNFSGGRYRTYCQHPSGGPSSTSSTSVVAVAGPTASTPRGSAIDVSNFSGGRCRTYRQHPPWGPAIDFLSVDGGHSQISSSGTSRGSAVDVS
jgi:hypothetical protein